MVSKMWIGVSADKDLLRRLERLRRVGAVSENLGRNGGGVTSWSVNRDLMFDLLGLEG